MVVEQHRAPAVGVVFGTLSGRAVVEQPAEGSPSDDVGEWA